MVTTVGLESSFLNMLGDLMSLEYDAVAAYDAAIRRIDDPVIRQQIEAFRGDHERHVNELDGLIREMGGAPSAGAGAKSMLTQGKVAIGAIFGDKAILGAMKTNEDDTNTAYERGIQYGDAPSGATELLRRGLADERRHRTWIEETIARL